MGRLRSLWASSTRFFVPFHFIPQFRNAMRVPARTPSIHRWPHRPELPQCTSVTSIHLPSTSITSSSLLPWPLPLYTRDISPVAGSRTYPCSTSCVYLGPPMVISRLVKGLMHRSASTRVHTFRGTCDATQARGGSETSPLCACFRLNRSHVRSGRPSACHT